MSEQLMLEPAPGGTRTLQPLVRGTIPAFGEWQDADRVKPEHFEMEVVCWCADGTVRMGNYDEATGWWGSHAPVTHWAMPLPPAGENYADEIWNPANRVIGRKK